MSRFMFIVSLLLPLSVAAETEDWDVSTLPGEATSVSIDVDNGSWMSLDVSPDGESLVFDLLGDIYRLPIAGGDAVAINSGVAWSMQPRFSPDGTRIAFTSDAGGGDNIWIMDADGSDARQLTKESFRLLNNPSWSPDGNYIAARKHFTTRRSLGTGEIWLYHIDGGNGVQVTERPSDNHQKEIGEPVFSADGRSIFFSLDATSGPIFQYAQDSNREIFRINRVELATGEVTAAVTGPGGAARPQPSPDGKYLAFVRRVRGDTQLFLKDLTSGAVRAIYAGVDQDLQEIWAIHGVYPNFAWMPDSSAIVIWAGGKIRRVDIETGEAATIPFRVRDTRDVYPAARPAVDVAPDTFNAKMVRSAETSPDGSKLVFESGGRLFVKALPDGQPRRLTRDEDAFEFFPSWSPDSRDIVFVRWQDDALGQIHSVRASGGKSRALTRQPGHYRTPRFAPNGEYVVYRATSGGYLTAPEWSEQTGIFRVSSRGGDAVLVTEDGREPHFGNGSERIFMLRRASGGLQLVSTDMNGYADRVHATGKYARNMRMAPDERHVLFRENYHVYVTPLPPGGQPVSVAPGANALPLVRLSGDGGNYPHWSADGETAYWSLGATLFSADVAAALARKQDEDDAGYEAPASGISMMVRYQADKPRGVVALTGAKLITMSDASGGIIEDGVVLIEDNRIKAVGRRGEVSIPADAKSVDVAGKTIVPGLIDAHAHGPQGDDVIPQQNWAYLATLALGVTTVHNPSSDATEIFAASEMQRAGTILAPRIFSTGDIVYGAKSTSFAKVDSADEAREHVRRLKAQGAMSIKNYNQPRREQRQQVVVAAREEGMLVVAEGGSLFHMDLSMVVDGNSTIEHNLPQSMLYDDVIQLWSQTNVAYTPTLAVTFGGPSAEDYWYQFTEVWKHPLLSRYVPPQVLQPRSVRRQMAPVEDYYHIVSAKTSKLLADAGVLVSIGAHGQREGLASHWEMWSFAQGGMDPIQVLSTATTQPAQALGYERDLGSIEAGKLADLVILDVDVTSDIFQSDRVAMVMLNGRLYDAATLNETVTGSRTTSKLFWQ